ncbi:TIGR02677 family protein [Nocardia thailandica]|uniref:TIGR02677 family protein n=1 Tax=Nocardia thailandica TaxID=257275 RepID=UPI0002EB0522|nr:TIGR02677 family protein [Nocardia thailandica]
MQADDAPRPFAHLGATNAELYRAVLTAFTAAKRRFTVHLRPDDLRPALRAADLDCDQQTLVSALTQLCEWGNLRADPDTARVTSVEEFRRARFLYQLTREGEAAETALAAYDTALGRRGALQSVALTDIVTQLRALLVLAAEPEPDEARTHLLLMALAGRFQDLADNAQAFMGSLQDVLDPHDSDVDAFLAYKDRLIDYLERFIKDLVGTGAEVASLITELDALATDALLDIAARREAADAAPDGTEDFRERAFARQRLLWGERWDGFHAWFVTRAGHTSQATMLRNQARSAVPRLLTVVAAFNDRRAGRSDRSADFRTLALWFAEATDDNARHTLWRAAFGLQHSRHLTVDADTLDARAADAVPVATTWAAAPAIEISPRLRKTGSYERRGRANKVIDRSEQRRYLAEMASKEAEQTRLARTALLAKAAAPLRLSDVGRLDEGAFRLFLNLLGDALTARRPGSDVVETTTSDGSLSIRLQVLETATTAEIVTDVGVFRGPDHLLQITDLIGDAG